MARPRPPDFRQIFDAELGYVWNTLRRLGVPERDRADVAHEVFVAVHRHLGTYDPARPLRPWIFAFAFRCASDYRRRAVNRREVLAADEREEARGEAATIDDDVGARALVAKALERLDENKRAVIVLHELEGWPVAEIAHALDVPLQTIYSRLRVAREELTAAVRALGKTRGGEGGAS